MTPEQEVLNELVKTWRYRHLIPSVDGQKGFDVAMAELVKQAEKLLPPKPTNREVVDALPFGDLVVRRNDRARFLKVYACTDKTKEYMLLTPDLRLFKLDQVVNPTLPADGSSGVETVRGKTLLF